MPRSATTGDLPLEGGDDGSYELGGTYPLDDVLDDDVLDEDVLDDDVLDELPNDEAPPAELDVLDRKLPDEELVLDELDRKLPEELELDELELDREPPKL